MLKVKSSHISHIAYAPGDKTLTIHFTNGSVYQYSGVSEKEYQALLGAESVGKHFIQNIKGKFKDRKL